MQLAGGEDVVEQTSKGPSVPPAALEIVNQYVSPIVNPVIFTLKGN